MGSMMMASIGIGIVCNLGLAELFGLAAGGLIVPGYLALALDGPAGPWGLASTLAVAAFTWLVVKGIGTFTILFGRRKIAVFILVSFLLNAALAALRASTFLGDQTYRSAGYIIPGLIATWFDSQGFVPTLAVLGISTVATKLVLLAAFGAGGFVA